MKSNVYMLMMLMFIKMFKKFKRQLSKTILNKKLKLVFLFLFVLGFLFNGSTAQALFGVGDFGIFDVAQVQLDALDFIDSTILKYFILLLTLILESTVFSALSASLLQWAINLPINLGNGLVVQGWNFVAGISNAFLVLILVFIALAYILKIETLDAKKALPKFILIALLINFSKVFVGIFVDIADIFQNTISIALGADFVSLAIEPLVASGGSVLAWLIGIILGYAGIALIPYGNIAALIILLTLFITGPLFQILGEAVVLIIFNFAAGMIFLFFTGLFLMRIAMIWILTIFSPLAFVASVLKTTKKHWDKWLNMLVSWSFLGIVVLFLLGLGLKFLGVIIAEPEQFSLTMEGGTFLFQKSMYYYLFILVYLGVVFKLSKENMPEFAEALISQAKTLTQRGGKMLGRTAVKRLRRVAATQEQREKEAKDMGGWKGRISRIGVRATKLTSIPVRWAYRAAGTTPEVAARKNIDGLTKNFEKEFGVKGEHIDQAIRIHGSKLGFKTLSSEKKAAFALYLAKTKGQEGFNKLDVDQQRKAIKSINAHSPNKVVDIVKHNPNLVNDKEVGTLVANKMVKDTEKDKEYQRLKGEGKTHEEALKESAFIKAATSIKASDIKDHNKSTLIGDDNEKLRKIWLERFGPEYWNQIAMNFDQEVMDSFSKTAEGMGAETLAKKNPGTLRYFAVQGQDRWGWKPLKRAGSKPEAKTFIEGVREKEAKTPPTPPVIPSFLHIEDKRIKEREQEIFKKREEGALGYEPQELDKMLKSHGITPLTPESDIYMKRWDKTEATKQLIKEEKELLKKPVSREIIEEIGLQRRNIRDKRKIQNMVKQINKEIDTAKEKIKEIKSLQDKPAISPAAQQSIATEIRTGVNELSKTEENLKNLKRRLKSAKVTMQAQIISNQNT